MECVYIDIDSSSTYCSLISQQKMLQDNAAPETVLHMTRTQNWDTGPTTGVGFALGWLGQVLGLLGPGCVTWASCTL